MLVLKNCKLISELTEGTSLSHADIVVEGDRISRIIPCNSEEFDASQVMDVKGATVIPGLINAHVHLCFSDNPMATSPFETISERTMDVYRFARYLLENGYTTVRDCGDDVNCPTIAVRNQINKGFIQGPNLICCGPTLIPSEVGTEAFEWKVIVCDTPDQFRVGARTVLKKGADYIKLYGTGSMLCPGSVPGARIMMEDEIRAAVEVADLKQTYTAIHCHGAECIDMAVECGVRCIEHATFITDETLKKMNGRKDVGLILSLSLVYEWLHTEPIPESKKRIIDDMQKCLKNAYAHDIIIGWGTDVDLNVQKKEVGMEFRLRKELLNCSNLDLLKQATVNSAYLLGIEDQVGTIKNGKIADLVVIEGDPLDDITLMYKAPAHVIKSGVVVR